MQTRKTLMISAAAVAMAMAAPSAQAASSYVSLFGGANFLGKFNSTAHMANSYYSRTESVASSFKTGFVVGGNYGVDWGTFRTEIELGFRQNKASKAHVVLSYTYYGSNYGPYVSNPTIDVAMRTYSLMANVWYDFHDVLPGGVTPYVGGGIGGAMVQVSGKYGTTKLNENNSSVFAWQLGAGASMPVSDSMKLYLDYRYFNAPGANLTLRPSLKLTHEFSASSHTVLVGLRINL
jgi:opacity protein-like surface antigen